jgi:threonine synthase
VNFYSTNNHDQLFTLKEAVLKGLPEDKGLFMPEHFNNFSKEFLSAAPQLSFQEIAFETAALLLGNSVDQKVLKQIVFDAINFDAPLVDITDRIYALELFHGPTLAFKDFGARFMAGLMAHFVKDENKKLTILVATSGDTGGAVAAGFHKREGIEVIILYPSGKVSGMQEKQLTTYGNNIAAIEISGNFDDCQRLVKSALTDQELTKHFWFSSANSINISRLIPQTFYYVFAWSRLVKKELPIVFSVPGGNFGNLTAGLFAKKMGLPVEHFIAATNINDIVPAYLITGKFIPKPSVQTISNAMDVGNPSNFVRMMDLYDNNPEKIKQDISGCSVDGIQTKETIKSVFQNHNYLLDPHGAVAFFALEKYLQQHKNTNGIFLETAHPAKFGNIIEEVTGKKIAVPQELEKLNHLNGRSDKLSNGFIDFKEFLLRK